VTATVDSLPLIASSIMSKKLASGADAIVLDVKTGSGALMETVDDAIGLAATMAEIGKLADKPVHAIVTGMGQPLGTHVGNALEVKEAIEVLSGKVKGDLLEVALLLGSHMLVLGKRAENTEHAREMLLSALRTGSGLSRLKAMIAAQGGDPACVSDVTLLPQPALIKEVKVGREGYIAAMDTEALGYAAQAMGAGRVQKTDVIDYSVGYILPVRIGDKVDADTTLCTLYARNEADAQKAEAAIRAAITIGDAPVERPPLWYAVVTAEGVERA